MLILISKTKLYNGTGSSGTGVSGVPAKKERLIVPD
jgi:hypothetical protein